MIMCDEWLWKTLQAYVIRIYTHILHQPPSSEWYDFGLSNSVIQNNHYNVYKNHKWAKFKFSRIAKLNLICSIIHISHLLPFTTDIDIYDCVSTQAHLDFNIVIPFSHVMPPHHNSSHSCCILKATTIKGDNSNYLNCFEV